ncbi:MAG: DUF3095 domain-containing protein [Chitinophagaceae bacterium]|nr:DUF3095 domain-containing protein [Chitinophagaceae bacterium]
MSAPSTDHFYTRLPVNNLPVSELLMEEHLFYKVPGNWHVLITDVKNSTAAALNGRHQTVNLVATGSIVAALNVAFKDNIQVPFFFGGDGATFIIPPSLLEPVLLALRQHRENTLRNFELELRVGHVPVEEVYAEGHELLISKLKASEIFNIPVLLGDGLTFAEKKIKSADLIAAPATTETEELDMSGMHCRWDKIKPPQNDQEVVSLLVVTPTRSKQAVVFKNVMEAIDRIYGPQEQRKPISINRLRMLASFKKIGAEMRVRLGGFNPWYLLRTWMATIIGKIYFKTGKGKKYLASLVEMSDTLVIDGKINTVITGSGKQREELQQILEKMEKEGQVLFGLHVSNESVMSCYVRNMNDQHIHFVDGADGGYTKAAGVLKKKLAALPVAGGA